MPTSPTNPWPIAITAVCVAFAAGLAVVVVIASRHQEDLVAPDYYARELRHQQQQESDSRGKAVAGYAFDFSPEARRIVVHFPAPAVTGAIVLYRPSNAALDRTIPIGPDAAGVQTIDTAPLAAGPWRVQLSWTLRGQRYSREHVVVVP